MNRVLLLSAYDADSHRHWHQSLSRGIDDWQWQVLQLPPRYFSWRVRGNPLTWSVEQRQLLERDYDLVLATSMVDLATLRGLVPALAHRPAVVYFHENQFAYPAGRGAHGLLEAQMVSLYSAMAAQLLLFNSDYNRQSFLQGCTDMLRGFPDAVPAGVVEQLRARSRVLPVPLDAVATVPRVRVSGPLQLLWNHRWEYDKGPAELLQLVQLVLARGLAFQLHVVGRQFRQQPAEFATIKSLLSAQDSLGKWGFIEDRREYLSLLQRCDVVLSTASHDFQGLSLLEACAAGCTPLAPQRLVYPEWFGGSFLYRDLEQAAARLCALGAVKYRGEQLPLADVSRFTPQQLLPEYRAVLHSQRSTNSVS